MTYGSISIKSSDALDMHQILPFTTKRVTINTDIPIAVKLIQGEIPSYYFNNLKTS